ncbi:MAG: sulfatase-like hydrolase/transferase [Verrucomicrobiota bacterium]
MRVFLYSIITVSLLSAFSAQASEQRPNIVFCFADDWGRHASIFAQIDGPGTVNDVISTPHFDALASEGVLFNNAFVSSPSCTPCRSSLLSGQHFWRTGMGSILMGEWDNSIPSYPLELEKHGYHIGFSYKVWGPGAPKDAPHGGGRARYMKAGKNFNGFSQAVTKSVRKGMAVEDAKNSLLENVIKGSFRNV